MDHRNFRIFDVSKIRAIMIVCAYFA